ncbi:putative RNA-directed DNA polymerase from transposon BS [Trichonephila clavipes]|nr:putative RNA-directed DNA polymerase from transposon BS [Trichonephila clavipes]
MRCPVMRKIVSKGYLCVPFDPRFAVDGWQEVSPADRGGERVYPLDPRPDAVALYSGCTPGKRHDWFLPDDRHTASLVVLLGGWRHARTKLFFALMDPKNYSRNRQRTYKSIRKLRSGDLLVEIAPALQTKSFLLAKTFLDCPLTLSPHKSLNSSRGVISEPDLMCASEAEILEGFSGQGVIQVKRITVKKDAEIIPIRNV